MNRAERNIFSDIVKVSVIYSTYFELKHHTAAKKHVLHLDDIPIRGFIGHLIERGFIPHKHKVFLWTHLNFNLEYNEDKVSFIICFSKQIFVWLFVLVFCRKQGNPSRGLDKSITWHTRNHKMNKLPYFIAFFHNYVRENPFQISWVC